MDPPVAVWESQYAGTDTDKVLVAIPGFATSAKHLYYEIIKAAAPHVRVVRFEHPRETAHFDHVQYAGHVYAELMRHQGADFRNTQVVLLLESAAVMTGLELLRLLEANGLLGNVKLFISESGLPATEFVKAPTWLLPYLPLMTFPYWVNVIITKMSVPRRYICGANKERLCRHWRHCNSIPPAERRAQLEALLRYVTFWHREGAFADVPLWDLRAELDRFVLPAAAEYLCWIFGANPKVHSHTLKRTVHGGNVENPLWDRWVLIALIEVGFLPSDVRPC
jgi:hypothetical protein